MQIRDVYPDPGSRIGLFSLPDPKIFHPGFRIRIKEFKYFNPKKWFLSSRVVHSGSRIRILTFYPSRIPDLGVKKAPDTRSASVTLHVTPGCSDKQLDELERYNHDYDQVRDQCT
jgi:hypothetical protein